MLWRPLPGHEDLNDAEQADCRESFRLILERCDPNLRTRESGQTILHEVIARDHGVGVSLASILLDAGAHTDVRLRGPNGVNMRRSHRPSGNREMTGSC